MVKKSSDKRDDNRAEDGPEETCNRDALDEEWNEPEHETVDDEREEAESQEGDREGDQFENGAEECVQKAKRERSPDECFWFIDVDGLRHVGDKHPEGEGESRPFDQKFYHIHLL